MSNHNSAALAPDDVNEQVLQCVPVPDDVNEQLHQEDYQAKKVQVNWQNEFKNITFIIWNFNITFIPLMN